MQSNDQIELTWDVVIWNKPEVGWAAEIVVWDGGKEILCEGYIMSELPHLKGWVIELIDNTLERHGLLYTPPVGKPKE